MSIYYRPSFKLQDPEWSTLTSDEAVRAWSKKLVIAPDKELNYTYLQKNGTAHIELAAPAVIEQHFKSVTCSPAHIFGITKDELNSVVRYEKYLLVEQRSDSKVSQYSVTDTFSNDENNEGMRCGCGPFFIQDELSRIDLRALAAELVQQFRKYRSLKKMGASADERIDTKINEIDQRFGAVYEMISHNLSADTLVRHAFPIIIPRSHRSSQKFDNSELQSIYYRIMVTNTLVDYLCKSGSSEHDMAPAIRNIQRHIPHLFEHLQQIFKAEADWYIRECESSETRDENMLLALVFSSH